VASEAWYDLGIRRSDLLAAERLAETLGRSRADRRRALITTGTSLGIACLLCVLLMIVVGTF
jgi:hypothetical protein